MSYRLSMANDEYGYVQQLTLEVYTWLQNNKMFLDFYPVCLYASPITQFFFASFNWYEFVADLHNNIPM